MLHLLPYFKLEGKSQLAYNKEALNSFNNQFEDDFVENCKECVRLSQEDKYKEDKNNQPSLLQFQEWDPIHDVVSEKINNQVDAIAVERELELEDEDTLIERKKEELKKWFINNYQHELNKRAHNGDSSAVTGQNQGKPGGDLSFSNLINLAQQIDVKTNNAN